jgi:hypothetical protein
MDTLTMTRPIDRLSANDRLPYLQAGGPIRAKRRHYSETLGDYYTISRDGSLLFDSGAEYTRAELDKVRQLSDETKKQIHNVKKIFKGAELL